MEFTNSAQSFFPFDINPFFYPLAWKYFVCEKWSTEVDCRLLVHLRKKLSNPRVLGEHLCRIRNPLKEGTKTQFYKIHCGSEFFRTKSLDHSRIIAGINKVLIILAANISSGG